MFKKLLGIMWRSPEKFPFAVAPNTAALACCHVLDGAPVLRVVHDAEGTWQFLCGRAHQTEDARVLALVEALHLDPTIAGVAGLPCGWCAERASAADAWAQWKQR